MGKPMKFVDWHEKLPRLQAEADEIRLTLRSISENPANRDRRIRMNLDYVNFLSNELGRINNQIYHLMKFKPIFIEEEFND